MIRREKRSIVYNFSFGEDFEIKAGLSNEGYHSHRIISTFELGNHQFLIRFKVECVEETQEIINEDLEDLKDQRVSDFSKLFYIQDGVFKPKTPVEITTYSQFIKKKWAQMFFSQTAYLVTGSQSKGKVDKIQKLSFDQINRKNSQTVMAKLDNLLEKIKEIVVKDKLMYRLIYDHQAKSLKIYELKNNQLSLPKDLLDQFSNPKF